MDDDQVVGILKRCSLCDRKTVHVGGVCRSHEVIERVAKPPATPRARPTRVAVPPPTKKNNHLRRWIGLAVVVGLVVLLGASHFVHGPNTGLHLCWKDGWTLRDTFVEIEDVSPNDPTAWRVLREIDPCFK